MKKMLGIVLLSTVLMAGCASQRTFISPKLEIIDIRQIQKVTVCELGDTVVEKGKIYAYDGINLKNQLTAGDGFLLKKITVYPGELKALAYDKSWTYYYANRTTVYDAILGEWSVEGGLMVSNKKSGRYGLFTPQFSLAPAQVPDYEKVKVYAVDKPSFRQELIYNGRVGNNIKFLYRELSRDIMRPAFSQEVQYDLGEGNVFGFKGVRIEIIEATNVQLKYKVSQSFPDQL